MVNLIDLAQQKNLDTLAGLNITPVASGKNASVNFVMGPPGSILKMHYLHGSEVTGNDTLQLISIFVPPFDGKDRIYI
jgi:hypothetical protein